MDLETLRIIWWVLLGVLLMGFAVMDGFDMGAAALMPLVARTESERRILLNTIGAVWEGNQVWIVLGAGAIFAAWSPVYAVAFSIAYLPVLFLLLTMGISRPVSFKYRSKLANPLWRRCWDWVVFCGGFFPAILFGVLVGNVLLGLPFYFDNNLQIHNALMLKQLFHPFALWCGFASLCMLVMHGGLFLAVKTDGAMRSRAIFWSRIGAVLLIAAFTIGGYWIARLPGYEVVGEINHNGYSNPLHKEVVFHVGGWLLNYKKYPITMLIPTLGLLGAFFALLTASWGTSRLAFVCSALSEIGVIGTVGISMFPFILPSSVNLSSSLLVWDASSSYLTLLVMLVATGTLMPIIMLYTAWVYRVLSGKLSEANIEQDKQAY